MGFTLDKVLTNRAISPIQRIHIEEFADAKTSKFELPLTDPLIVQSPNAFNQKTFSALALLCSRGGSRQCDVITIGQDATDWSYPTKVIPLFVQGYGYENYINFPLEKYLPNLFAGTHKGQIMGALFRSVEISDRGIETVRGNTLVVPQFLGDTYIESMAGNAETRPLIDERTPDELGLEVIKMSLVMSLSCWQGYDTNNFLKLV